MNIDFLNENLYSAFPMRTNSELVIWMVNLKKKEYIFHGEGKDFREAFLDAYKKWTEHKT